MPQGYRSTLIGLSWIYDKGYFFVTLKAAYGQAAGRTLCQYAINTILGAFSLASLRYLYNYIIWFLLFQIDFTKGFTSSNNVKTLVVRPAVCREQPLKLQNKTYSRISDLIRLILPQVEKYNVMF